MTSKQRAYLKKLANTCEPIFQVGKSSVTPELIEAISDALEARELIKLSVLKKIQMKLRRLLQGAPDVKSFR